MSIPSTSIFRWLRSAFAAWLFLSSVAAANGPEVYLQRGHSQRVLSVAVSPDSRTLASCGADGSIKLWDLRSGRELRTLEGLAEVDSVAFSRDGGTLASGGADRSIKLWDVSSGRLLRTLRGHSQAVLSVAFSADGRNLASASLDGHIKIWDPASGAELRTLEEHLGVNSVAFSADGHTLASGNVDHGVRLWDVTSGRLLRTLAGHSQAVYTVSFSPDGRALASGGQDRSIKIWDVATGRELLTLSGHSQPVLSVAFKGDGATLASGSNDRSVKIWDIAGGREIRTLSGLSGAAYSVAFVPSGSSLAAGIGDSSIRLWDVTDGQELRVFSGHSKIVRTVAFSPDGHTVASGGEDHSIALWDVASGRRLRTLGQHSDIVESVVFAPDGHLLASASRDGVKLWNLDNSRELRTLVGHNDWVYSVAFSPDGHTLASGGADATVRLWNVANGRELRKLTGHFDPVYAIAISPDGRTLASGSVDQNIKLWDLAKGRELRTLRGHSGYVASVAFSPDGRELVSASSDNSIKLWDVDRGVELRTFAGHTGALSVTYSSDGRTVASAGADREIHLWNPDTGQQVRQLSGHAGTVWSVAFSPDARMLVSGSRDHTVRLWSATDGHEQASAIAFDDDSVVAITPEGFYDYQGGTAEQNLLVRTGPQLFDVTDVAAFRERFYRPDLVRQSLSGQALPASLAPLSSVRPAPAISIGKLPAQIDRAALNLPVTLVDRGGGVGDVRVTVNGSAVSETKGAGTQIANATGTVSKVIALQLVPGANLISVRAYNADGSMLSEPDTAIVSADYAAKRPLQLHALIVGIDRFRNPDLNLQFAVSDATAVAQMLQRRAAPLFGQVNVELRVTPEKTTRDALLSALAGYRAMPPDDVFLLYVASHGTVDESDPVSRDYYLIPSNIGLTSYEAVRREAISQKELQQLVANIPATKKVLLLDTCQAGALADAFAHAPRGMEEQRAINILSRAVGATVLSASTNQEQALEGKDGHGVFTWVVLQALDGKADLQRNGYVTTLDLADYVSDQVPKVAEQIFRREQFPVLTNSGQPFPIVSSK